MIEPPTRNFALEALAGLVDGPSEHRLNETCGQVVACGRFGDPSWAAAGIRRLPAPALVVGFGRCPWRFPR
jgi:hypothetical protein